MSFSQQLVANMPSFVLAAIMVAIAVIISVGGMLFVHRFIPHHRLKAHNDITGPIFSTLGVIYAVMLAFMVVIIWQKFDRAGVNVDMEANCIVNLYVDAEPFEESFRQDIRGRIVEYTKAIVDEWDAMGRGDANLAGGKLIEGLAIAYSAYSPKNETDKIFFKESVHKMNELFSLRIFRLVDARRGLHPLLWFVLIIGGVITIIFTIFFGTESLRAKILMSTLLAILIVLVLFTILEFSFPFTGKASISSEAFEVLLKHLR